MRDARLGVDDEDDDVGLVDGHDGLLANLGREGVVRLARLDATGVDEREVDTVPVGVVQRAVACDAHGLVHDGLGALGNTVNKGGLAHVGATHHGYDWLCHGSPLTDVLT